MSVQGSVIARGRFTSTGAAQTIELPTKPDYFEITNRSLWGSNPNDYIRAEWYTGMTAGQALNTHESGAGALTAVASTTLGITEIDYSNLTDGAEVAITAITAANPAVASAATTPLVGDIVRITDSTGMLQIAGMEFTVGIVVDGVSFQLAYLDASGFAAAATAGNYRIIRDPAFLPRRRYIVGITAANPAVVTTSIAHGYSVGDKVRILVPDAFGMTQINNQVATITAVTESTFTTDINSAAYTAFAFPTSAVAGAGVSFPVVIPEGEVSTTVSEPVYNDGYYGLHLGTDVVGNNTNVMEWVAMKGVTL